MSTDSGGSLALQRVKVSYVLGIHDRIIFEFYLGLPPRVIKVRYPIFM